MYFILCFSYCVQHPPSAGARELRQCQHQDEAALTRHETKGRARKGECNDVMRRQQATVTTEKSDRVQDDAYN